MSEQPSTWPPPKRKSKAWFFGVAIVLFVFAKFALVFGVIMYSQGRSLVPPGWKDFEDLDTMDRSILQYDSVYGDYLEWTGEEVSSFYPVTRRLVFDESGKFATKVTVRDTTDFFSKIPGDIDLAGRWSESNEKLILKFYFPPERWSEAFDSLKNESSIRIIDSETIELNLLADTVWMGGIPCVKKRE